MGVPKQGSPDEELFKESQETTVAVLVFAVQLQHLFLEIP